MMKKVFLVVFVLMFIVLLTGCGIEDNNPDLVADLSKQDLYIQNTYDQNDLVVDSVETIKRNTDKENKNDVIYVEVIAANSSVECHMQYQLVYNYYTEGGWILDECIPENTDDWEVNVIAGLNDKEIQETMQHIANYGNDYEDFYTNVRLASQKTFYDDNRHEMYLELKQELPYCDLKANFTCVHSLTSGCSDAGLWWFWDRCFDQEEYEIIDENYDVMCGEWYEKGTEQSKYEIVKIKDNQYKLIYTPFAYSTDPDSMLIWPREQPCFETTFTVNDKTAYIESASYILDRIYGIKMETKQREEFSSPSRVKLEFRSDGTIYLFRGVGPYFQGEAYLTKK